MSMNRIINFEAERRHAEDLRNKLKNWAKPGMRAGDACDRPAIYWNMLAFTCTKSPHASKKVAHGKYSSYLAANMAIRALKAAASKQGVYLTTRVVANQVLADEKSEIEELLRVLDKDIDIPENMAAVEDRIGETL